MTRALPAAFGSITGSSVTTIVGLLMLVFMRFKIGMDLGIVLAKGVLCSLLCVFTVLPGLILWADKVVRKTMKKPRAPKRERKSVLAGLGRFSYRCRGVIAAAFVLLFAGAYILQLSTQISYTLTDPDPVAEVFPPDNPIVVLYTNAAEDEPERQYIANGLSISTPYIGSRNYVELANGEVVYLPMSFETSAEMVGTLQQPGCLFPFFGGDILKAFFYSFQFLALPVDVVKGFTRFLHHRSGVGQIHLLRQITNGDAFRHCHAPLGGLLQS